MARLVRTALGAVALGSATLAYSTLVEPFLFTLRRFEVPVLAPGTRPLRLLHISDLHLLPRQQMKADWVRSLAELKPDFVVNTGDTWTGGTSLHAVMHALEPLMELPGAFVPGNADYFRPIPKSPTRYFTPQAKKKHGEPLPWQDMAAAMKAGGWLDLTHVRSVLDIGGVPVALTGLDDPHLRRAEYDLVAGTAEPEAAVRIGVLHSPEPTLLRRFAEDGYDLTLAGHTHGGQVRVPFGPAIVTNCGIDVQHARWLHEWDENMYFHICAGLGANPYLPIRFACRPEASLLTLVPRFAVAE
jgi:predicted MPP superfamily phosphohydrolase